MKCQWLPLRYQSHGPANLPKILIPGFYAPALASMLVTGLERTLRKNYEDRKIR